ncbi:endo alpha-1,4 polygalactosaminidase [Vibrio sp. 947]|uniref:endo alpha-1,4 polygalactosaminidase n=1 Tax=Vibrio TaxID=662 RepID=UPI001CDB5A2D|nr:MULTISPECIES: endo alpha-1,4 polygalactosaminidase [Vibrio]MCA2422603.1 endo alpha-1,4 polygalactosaminidase [Vibrio alginolyticus]MCA2447236.1 endo alpha-1,4 polygalactosaminidase [Vibrio alginolyticus]MDW1929374.1 endo alpha-1,4 polygalactosaminidase [Vibrio sp. 947]MDW1948102.1 endo alpha-1,4 polygalactosaminidase [Vibrio sp. 812(2023)]MDW1990883.1 endo alpha-1,4 polygalactosaminidase [Vibrio sp. 780]
MRSSIMIFLLIGSFNATAFGSMPSSIAFYYNQIDSVRELMNYDRVVVNPMLITPKQIATLQTSGTLVFAYLSVGEYSGATLPASLLADSPLKNRNWNSYVMNLTSSNWQTYLLDQAALLTNQHFDGLFLDTLDSYTLLNQSDYDLPAQQSALINILTALSNSPNKPKLMFNRGFELLDSMSFKPYAVVAESLYHKYDPASQAYSETSANDSKWLNNQLDRVKAKGIETIVIDYIPASRRADQKRAAQRLIDEKNTPYISDGLLYEFGTSSVEPIARRVLGLYDSSDMNPAASSCHRNLAMPIEYLGYVPECVDIKFVSLNNLDISRYAGVVIWLDEGGFQQFPAVQNWVNQLIGSVPVLFINALPTDPKLLAKLGIQADGKLSGKTEQRKGKDWTAGHYPVSFSAFDSSPAWQSNNSNVKTLVSFVDKSGNESTLLFSAPWGGAALSPLPMNHLANGQQSWAVDPFRLIAVTLNLPVIPSADITTESGQRILTSHIDGDGFGSKTWLPDTPTAGEVVYQQILRKYSLPVTVSVVAGDIASREIAEAKRQALTQTAKKIFSQSNVEIASHTYSHPEYWYPDSGDQNAKQPSSSTNIRHEIVESTEYINAQLAPASKKAKLILWSGQADPDQQALTVATNAHLLNVNGGNSYAVNGADDLSRVSAAIQWYPNAVQVYAPIANELSYTRQWTANYDGYRRVLETFAILGEPRRLKPISIYFNMYSAEYPASLQALKSVYDWAISQPTTPLFLSEYALRAQSLYETGIAKTLDGRWQVTSSGVKSIRLADKLGYPAGLDLAGWNQAKDGKFLILKQPRTVFSTHPNDTKAVRLQSANGVLLKWQQSGSAINWSIQSHRPLELTIYGAQDCQPLTGEPLSKRVISKGSIQFHSSKSGVLSGTLRCVPLR